MSASVAELEEEVGAARERLRASLAALRSPKTIDRFKAELLEEKDELLRKAADAARDAAGRAIQDVKARAMANPAATLSIGAGLAWHVLRHPPITSLLVGMGIFGLSRTDPVMPTDGVAAEFGHQVKRAVGAATDTAQTWSTVAGETIEHESSLLIGTSRALLQDARDQLSEVGAEFATQSAETAKAAAAQAQRSFDVAGKMAADETVRDQFLLGAAAASIVAAIGVALRRAA